jgi:hypothetical protein
MESIGTIEQVADVKRKATALAFFLYPLLAAFAFATHPGLLTPVLKKNVEERIAGFHGNALMHFGHLMMALASMILIVIALDLMKRLERKSPWAGFLGGVAAIFGAVILSMDKAALCFVPSALDTLGGDQFLSSLPALEAIFGLRGYLGILNLLPVLPAGFAVLSAALLKTGTVKKSTGVPMLIGSILMCNPDIDLIGLAATLVLGIGFYVHGLSVWNEGEAGKVRGTPGSQP